jgi:diguanylate cyclase (GGDEF)-like protein/PAS domain S-box-containing protein
VATGEYDKSLSARPKHRILLALSGIAALVWVVASWLIADHWQQRDVAAALAHESGEIEQLGRGIAAGTRQILGLRSGIAATLAENEQVRRALMQAQAGKTDSASVTALNRFLGIGEKRLAVGALWVGDAAGRGFAAANAGTAASPIGVDYRDRAYFQEAKAGRLGHQFAVGRTTRIPGMFFSAPVMNGEHFLGFVVVKIDMSSLAPWVDQADAFITDKHGVVILARDKGLEMLALPDAGVFQLDAATRRNTYRRAEFHELGFDPWHDSRYPSLRRLDHRAVPVIAQSYSLPEYELTLTVTRPFPQLAMLDQQRNGFFALLAGIGLLLLAGAAGSLVYLKNMHHSRRMLRRQKRQLDEAQQLAHLGSWDLDLRNDTLTWSDASHAIFQHGSAAHAASYEAFLDTIHPDDRKLVDEAYRDSVARRVPGEIVHRMLLADGGVKFMHERWETRYDGHGKPTRTLGSVQDITARRAVEAQLRLAASVFESAHEGICITDPDERILDVNATFCDTTGYAREEVLGKTPRMLGSGRQPREFYAAMWQALAADGHWQGELWNRRRDGTDYAERLTLSAVRDAAGAVSHYVGILSDITAARQHADRLEKIAHFDVLTGIPNRALLADRMHQAIAQTSRTRSLLAICYLDLDGFKAINDTLGHAAGDRVLVEMAKRLAGCLRGGDTVARLGGDEFVLLLLGLMQTDECEFALQRILEATSYPVEAAAGQLVALSASIGVTLYPHDLADADTLLRHADRAMYQAKQQGKNRYEFFDAQGMSA